ncbi:PREDICTED: podocan-like protein 1 [Bison bison bison]|uniref:Podocan-like protein 1 n=1 Tax=Bison bison bison TaxID=43346 RepID=A0A6P3IHH5_BISBB|nr:PREDICTED: podocan-like protein 1 [Bison bison bison]
MGAVAATAQPPEVTAWFPLRNSGQQFGRDGRARLAMRLSLLLLLLLLPVPQPALGMEDDASFPHLGESSQPPPRACPPRCSCPRPDTVDCDGLDLRVFPDNITRAAQHLSLQNNQLQELPYNELSRLSGLRTLNLHNNLISSEGLPDEAFESLTQLQSHSLLPSQNNLISKVPRGALSRQTHLRELYLQHNQLTDSGLDATTFSKLHRLEYLDLSHNQLAAVPAGLPRTLALLHLGRNRIRWVEAARLGGLRGLRYLLLQHNQLGATGLLDLAGNQLTQLPSGLPAGLHTLRLQRNQLRTLEPEPLAGLHQLQELSLAHNRLRVGGIGPGTWHELQALQVRGRLVGHTIHRAAPSPLCLLAQLLPWKALKC